MKQVYFTVRTQEQVINGDRMGALNIYWDHLPVGIPIVHNQADIVLNASRGGKQKLLDELLDFRNQGRLSDKGIRLLTGIIQIIPARHMNDFLTLRAHGSWGLMIVCSSPERFFVELFPEIAKALSEYLVLDVTLRDHTKGLQKPWQRQIRRQIEG